MADYIVTTDGEALTRAQSARLYRMTGYRQRAVLAATGTLEQMQNLADALNGAPDDDGKSTPEPGALAPYHNS